MSGARQAFALPRPLILRDNPRELRILAFSDCRVQPLDWFVQWVRDFGAFPDLILYAGDDIARFRPDRKTNYFEQLASLTRYGLFAVAGNDDLPDQRHLITGHKVYDVHRTPVLLGKYYCVIGLEGAPDRPGVGIGYLLHPERRIEQHLAAALHFAGSRRILIVSHAPPYGCLDLAQRFGVRRIGSKALAACLKRIRRPSRGVAAVVCGHVHRCGGEERNLGSTVVVNVASHDDAGAPLRIATIHDKAGWIEQPALVHSGLACEHDELQKVNGIGPDYAAKLAKRGVKTLNDLATCAPEVVGRAISWGAKRAAEFPLRAQALLKGEPIRLGPLELPTGPRLIFDIETDVPPKLVWLVGCYIESTGEVRQFLAARPSQERKMLQEFLRFVRGLGPMQWLYFSASDFDRRILAPRLQHHGLAVPEGLSESVDAHPFLRAAVAAPTDSFGLKEVAAAFGYRYRHPELDGMTVAFEYMSRANRGRPIPKRLMTYNRDDLLSLSHLIKRVTAFCNGECVKKGGRPAAEHRT
jgi:Icc-related predicted phosphoesterase